ncbi:MAG TPA: hypothetical protein VGQ83_17040 [Polyangia bacterium]|jgi:hypothetical protein
MKTAIRLARALAAAAVLATLVLASHPALAAPPPGSPQGDDGFKPVPAGQAVAEPTLTSPMLVKVAYSLIWLAVCGYLVGLWRRGQRLAAEMEDLRRRLDPKLHVSEKASS